MRRPPWRAQSGHSPTIGKWPKATRYPNASSIVGAQPVEQRRVDGEHRITGLADEVLLRATGQNVETRPVTEMHVAHEPDLLETLQVAVHRREVRPRHAPDDALGDLLRGKRRLGSEQGLEHQSPGRRRAQAALAQERLRLVHALG
jgi:hypothetical protein